MLTLKQKRQIKKGFGLGLADTHIANYVPGVTHMDVYKFRHELNISSSTIVNKRYDVWAHLITLGADIKEIEEIYSVKERSIKILLWKHREISFVAIKHQHKNKLLSDEVCKKGIPDLSKYGL